MLRSLSHFPNSLLKRDLICFCSQVLSEVRSNPLISSESLSNDYESDKVSHTNLDLIEIGPYEHYFNFSQIDNNALVSVNPCNNNEKQNLSDVKLKASKLLEAFDKLEDQVFLPQKLKVVIKTVRSKIDQWFPNCDKTTGLGTSTFAANFIKDCINSTNQNASFIDVSIQIADFESAFRHMSKIRLENKSTQCLSRSSVITDSIFYEPAINILARRGKVGRIIGLLNEMDSSNISPSLTTIFRAFEAVGRKAEIDKLFVERLIAYCEEHYQLSLNQALIKAPISKDNFQFILKSIKCIYPDFSVGKELGKKVTTTETFGKTLKGTTQEMGKCFDKQLEFERRPNVLLDPIFKLNVNKSLANDLENLETKWKKSLKIALRKKIRSLEHSERSRLVPFLSVLPESSYVNCMIQMLYQLINDNGLQFSNIRNVYYYFGDSIFRTYQYKSLKKQNYFHQLKSVYQSFFVCLQQNPKKSNLSELWEQSIFMNVENGNIIGAIVPWDNKLKSSIGKLMYEIMYETLKFPLKLMESELEQQQIPVLYEHTVEEFDGISTIVRVHFKLSAMYKDLDKAAVSFPPTELPMLHPPVPFYQNYSTGFFHMSNYATRFIRKASNIDLLFDDDLHQPNDITNVYDALNVLGQIAWQVDQANLDLIKLVFQNKGNLKLKVPLFTGDMTGPDAPSNCAGSFKDIIRYNREVTEFKKQKKEMYSLWITLFYKLSIAERFRHEKFWFPYSMDFRSRVYPCPPHLNHIGDDVSRGLLKFANGKQLGKNGLDWLKIHVINLYGSHKRSSNDDRLKAANENLSEIIDSAVNPFQGRHWWQSSEKPWQTLLACREIHEALKFADESGNGSAEEFVSYIGVHQDGSCNGLQHYAALAKDLEGAQAVNLVNSEVPQDVYSDVLRHVEERRQKDAENGIAEAQQLKDLITRKVIKQTVMTTVYGVTQFGAKEQIQKHLKELYNLPHDKLWKCSLYLSKVTLDSIGEIFSSATKIQKWFIELASVIGKNRQANISWKTPLNLIVSQPYFADSSKEFLKADVRKNRNAFPPNFVHSLDSTHMMMTALRCWQENVTFVSVHDCYWTHACDVDRMNKICREEFVKLHSQPILHNLSDYIFDQYGYKSSDLNQSQKSFNGVLRKVPKTGKFQIDEVLKSTYFFS